MSGGVDSSVAVALLLKEGYEVIGGHIKAWSIDEKCADQDVEDARLTAEKLGILFYVFDFEKEYQEKVINYFVETYKNGGTPSPDVLCNKEIKFGVFLDKAKAIGADFVATGHYARIKEKNNIFKIIKGKDSNKDQSYFLWQLNQEQLSKIIFPIGNYLKSEIREMAKKFNLPMAEKKDSQGICFLGQIELKEFLRKFLKVKRGDIIIPSGEVVGEHEGAVFYTIGQRHGFDLSSSEAGFKTNEPLFIIDKNVSRNTITVALGRKNPLLYKSILWLDKVSFISNSLDDKIRSEKLRLEAIIRYRQKPQRALIEFNQNKKLWKIEFDELVWAPAISQHVVFYQKDELLGGGVIVKIE